jgi:hypothetical protein
MSFRLQPIVLGFRASEACLCPDGYPAGGTIAESPPQYRPRHPERSAFYQLFETHFESYVRSYEERFEPHSGPLRSVVAHSVEEFLSCGRLQGGFARIRCDKCRKEHLLALSCRTRNFCSSCQAKRSVLFAEKLAAEILAPVPHRHWTFSIPRVLRGLFERERGLLSLLSQTAYASIVKTFQALLGREDIRPGCVFSLQTFGAYGANFNPHCHGLVTDGAFSADGQFLPLGGNGSIPAHVPSTSAPGRAAIRELHAESFVMGPPGIFRLCRPAGPSRRNRLPGIASPIHHPAGIGHGCAARTRRRQTGYGNAARSQDRRNLHRAGSARMDPPHHVAHPRSQTSLSKILWGLLQPRADLRGGSR